MEKQTREFLLTEERVSYSKALKALRKGARIARAGWNGKGMYLVHFSPVSHGMEILRVLDIDGGTEYPLLPFILMKTADDCYVPWLASQTDMLEDDWCIFELGYISTPKEDIIKYDGPAPGLDVGFSVGFSPEFLDSFNQQLVFEVKDEIEKDTSDTIIKEKIADVNIKITSNETSPLSEALKNWTDDQFLTTKMTYDQAKLYRLGHLKTDYICVKSLYPKNNNECKCSSCQQESKSSLEKIADEIHNDLQSQTGIKQSEGVKVFGDMLQNQSSSLNDTMLKTHVSRVNEILGNELNKMFNQIIKDAKRRQLTKKSNSFKTFFVQDKTITKDFSFETYREFINIAYEMASKGYDYLRLTDGTFYKLKLNDSELTIKEV